jgi:hypothetical protein
MRRRFAVIPALLLALLISAAQSSVAQTSVSYGRAGGTMSYDVSDEATLGGTVAAVFVTPSAGMLAGSHLLLTTLSGSVDISLGTYGLRGKGALSLTEGQQIEVTGVMKIFRGAQVFLARNVKAGGTIYAIRNEHGIPVTPYARQRASQTSQSGGKQ